LRSTPNQRSFLDLKITAVIHLIKLSFKYSIRAIKLLIKSNFQHCTYVTLR